MPKLPDPEPGYTWARLEDGPLGGEIILAPTEAHRRNLPASMIGVLAPVLDEVAETIEWSPVTYLCPPQYPPKQDELWRYVSVRDAG
jgi:hypothetical protein